MASIKLTGLMGVVGIVVGGLIISWAYGLDWLMGIGVVAILFVALFVSIFIALFIPIGNMIVKGVAFVVAFGLLVLYGFNWIGVM